MYGLSGYDESFKLDDYNYPESKISINLKTVFDTAIDMIDDLSTIETKWGNAMYYWDRVNDGISWVGKTQKEVDEFQAQIVKVQNQIFGTNKENPDNPDKPILDKPGLYQQVRELALGATQNYDNTDFTVSRIFTQLLSNITDETYAMGTDANGDFVTIKPQPEQKGNAPDQTKPPISETF
jgi:hypothetical protein